MTEIEPIPVPSPVPLETARRRDQNPYWVYLARFSGESERTMRRCLDRVAAMLMQLPCETPARNLGEMFPWEQLRYAHVKLLRTRLTAAWPSLSHVNKHLSAIRGVTEESWTLGLMSAEEYQRICKVKNIKGSRELAGRNVHSDEIAAMLAACLADSNAPLGIRDAAIIAVLQSTGIRRDEAACALIERYDHGERSLRVVGKGNKERTVYLHQAAVLYLDRWLVTAASNRRGPIFRHVDRWGHIGTKPMSARSIGYVVSERRAQAGLPSLATHDFRRTFIGDFIDAGGDLVQAQQLAGHASATTTAAYDRRPGRALRAAVDRLSLPSPDELTDAKGKS